MESLRQGTAEATADDEGQWRDQMLSLVQERPILVAVAAGAIGASVGGLLFGRLARLVFFGAVGYVANELWRNDGRFDLLRKLTDR